MSYGLAFALPALITQGGGGTNPFGQLGPTLDLSFAGPVTSTTDPYGYTLNTNFLTPQYQVATQYAIWETGNGLVSKNFSDIVTFTRASTATYFDSTGTLTTAAIDAPRFDYNPTTLAARGLLVEAQRTNSIRNNTGVGAVAGTPGTLPTNWVTSSVAGVSVNVIGTGNESGITYVDVQFVGTPSATGQALVAFDGFSNMAATPAATYTGSFYIRRSAGSNTNVSSIINQIVIRNSGGVNIGGQAVDITSTVGAANIRTNRPTNTFTTPALTAFIQHDVRIGITSGLAIDITLRIGLPQLEQVAGATVINTITVVSGGSGYALKDALTLVGGTFTGAAAMVVTGVSAGGVITSVALGSVGNYTVVPTNPVSVTGGTGSLATFNLTSVFQTETASSVIPTSTAAVTRTGDYAQISNISAWYNSSASTLYAEFQGAASYCTAVGAAFHISNAANSNNTRVFIHPSLVSAATQNNIITTINQGKINANLAYTGALTKAAGAFAQDSRAISANGTSAVTSSISDVPLVATLAAIGTGAGANFDPLNGWVSRITYYPRRLSNAELQGITAGATISTQDYSFDSNFISNTVAVAI
jgi:hypothetical protein